MGGLCEIEFTVSILSNARNLMHIFLYKGRNCQFVLGDIEKIL